MTQPAISFEFFPPKTDKGKEKLKKTREDLARFQPEYYSVTYGAGGSTREGTLETIDAIQTEGQVAAAPHISCIGATRENIQDLLNHFISSDIKRVVSLRGDIPSGMAVAGEFNYASELTRFIREETGDHFHIEVAAYPEVHPEAISAESDIQNLKRKADAGANSAITQYFFNADAYFYFVDRCQQSGINIPIVPGIMPITNHEQLARFSSACGAELPRWLDKRLSDFNNDLDSIRSFGIDIIANMCRRLLDNGAPGLHFYTLNQSQASINILDRLDLN